MERWAFNVLCKHYNYNDRFYTENSRGEMLKTYRSLS
jgi:hypothetical protein